MQIIPYTWEHTNLQFAKVNDLVNLECDMLGKYVLRAMETWPEANDDAAKTKIARSRPSTRPSTPSATAA